MSNRWREPSSQRRGFARPRVVPFWSMLVTLGMLLSQLFALGHLVLFTHTRCEHGALVHGAAHTWQVDARRSPPAGDAPAVSRSGEREQEDEHCAFLATPPALQSVAAASLDAALVAAPSVGVFRACGEWRAVSILSLAPKTSPTA